MDTVKSLTLFLLDKETINNIKNGIFGFFRIEDSDIFRKYVIRVSKNLNYVIDNEGQFIKKIDSVDKLNLVPVRLI